MESWIRGPPNRGDPSLDEEYFHRGGCVVVQCDDEVLMGGVVLIQAAHNSR
jgi:hypothetical protein